MQLDFSDSILGAKRFWEGLPTRVLKPLELKS